MVNMSDIAEEVPTIGLPIKWVSIKDRHLYIKVKDVFSASGKTETIFCRLAVGLSLPENKRAIHTSRIEKVIFESSAKDYQDVKDFATRVSHDVYNSQHCRMVYVDVEGTTFRMAKTPETKFDTQQKIILACKNIYDGKENHCSIRLTTPIFSACPACMKDLQRQDGCNGYGSHSQKANVTIKISNPGRDAGFVDMLASLEKVSTPLFHMLKMPDEGAFVLKSLKNPLFVEDASRKIIYNLFMSAGKHLGRGSVLTVKIDSNESIHPHNISAEISLGVDEIKNYLKLKT
jgi:GTP cyclohydrolase FolE2